MSFLIRTFIFAASLSFSAAAFAQFDEETKISPDLQRALDNTSNPIPVVVVLDPVTPLPMNLLGSLSPAQKEVLIKQRTRASQAQFQDYINEIVSIQPLDGDVKPLRKYMFFWGVNGFMATATPEIIMDLASREEVRGIFLDRKIKLAPDYRTLEDLDGGDFTYGLQKIGVPELRAAHPDLTGKGVRVGIIDTGIDSKHPEFTGRIAAFRDFVGEQKEGYDDNGHGTHVAGTIAGSGAGGTQIGVAPEATLVIGKAFTGGGSASLSSLVRAMEWMGDPDGNAATNDRPRVVSNSWGGGPSADANKDPFYQLVLTWLELGIFPSFAAGNSGPGKGTVGSPGCLPPSFAVAATDENDEAAVFSSRGPVKIVVDGKKMELVKPDIAAPGVGIYSAMPGGKYGKMSGTSMATPHVSGAIALVYQVKPNATIEEVKTILSKSADPLGTKDKNTTFGAGRLNVFKASSVMGFDDMGFGF